MWWERVVTNDRQALYDWPRIGLVLLVRDSWERQLHLCIDNSRWPSKKPWQRGHTACLRMDLEKMFEIKDACWRTGREYHECEDDTLKPRRLRVYPRNLVDCKQPLRFVLDQLLEQHQELPDTKNHELKLETWNTREKMTDRILQGIITWLTVSGLHALIRRACAIV